MKNIAPAIFPPNGIGDTKPANQAVLYWVHELDKLTKPENIFWCDGSERENEFLIAESLKQNVLIKLNEKKVPRSYLLFFFQAEDGIRDYKVTGVQTCALPI